MENIIKPKKSIKCCPFISSCEYFINICQWIFILCDSLKPHPMHASNPYANEVIWWQIYRDFAVVFFQFYYSLTFFFRDIGLSSSKIHVLFIKLAAAKNNIHSFKHSIHFIDSFHIMYCQFFFFIQIYWFCRSDVFPFPTTLMLIINQIFSFL